MSHRLEGPGWGALQASLFNMELVPRPGCPEGPPIARQTYLPRVRVVNEPGLLHPATMNIRCLGCVASPPFLNRKPPDEHSAWGGGVCGFQLFSAVLACLLSSLQGQQEQGRALTWSQEFLGRGFYITNNHMVCQSYVQAQGGLTELLSRKWTGMERPPSPTTDPSSSSISFSIASPHTGKPQHRWTGLPHPATPPAC
jgi:hypothetical protein